jgi:hypothetical protein
MAKTGQIHIVKAEKDGETTQYWVVMCPRESATEIVQQTIGADWRLTVTGHRPSASRNAGTKPAKRLRAEVGLCPVTNFKLTHYQAT